MMDHVGLAVFDVRITEWSASGPFEGVTNLKFDVNTSVNSQPEQKRIQIINSIKYYDKEKKGDHILAFSVLTDFGLDLGDENVKPESVDVPDQAIITMISISISHTRALLSDRCKAFGLMGVVLPLLNPTEIFNNLKKQWEGLNN